MNQEQNKLKEISDYLQKLNFQLSSGQNDGRINSILNEDEVLKLIEQNFDINVPQARDWSDFYIGNMPVNIKITTTNTADNVSSKNGLYFALTGKIYAGKELLKRSKNENYRSSINK